MPATVIAAVKAKTDVDMWEEVKKRKDTKGKELCAFYFTKEGCARTNCKFSHESRNAKGQPHVNALESEMLTRHRRTQAASKPYNTLPQPNGQRREGSRGPKGGGKGGKNRQPSHVRDKRGICFNEDFGRVQCTDVNCNYKHRRPDFKNPNGKKATGDELELPNPLPPLRTRR